MDYNYVENLIREDIKNKCPQLTNEIIEEYLDLTFFRSSWVTYGDNKDIYLVGIAEGKYDFYYVGFDDNQNLKLISCALDIKPNKKRDNDFIPKFNRRINVILIFNFYYDITITCFTIILQFFI